MSCFQLYQFLENIFLLGVLFVVKVSFKINSSGCLEIIIIVLKKEQAPSEIPVVFCHSKDFHHVRSPLGCGWRSGVVKMLFRAMFEKYQSKKLWGNFILLYTVACLPKHLIGAKNTGKLKLTTFCPSSSTTLFLIKAAVTCERQIWSS